MPIIWRWYNLNSNTNSNRKNLSVPYNGAILEIVYTFSNKFRKHRSFDISVETIVVLHPTITLPTFCLVKCWFHLPFVHHLQLFVPFRCHSKLLKPNSDWVSISLKAAEGRNNISLKLPCRRTESEKKTKHCNSAKCGNTDQSTCCYFFMVLTFQPILLWHEFVM